MIKYIRLTKSQIKLVVARAGVYHSYNLINDRGVLFNSRNALKRYYGRNTIHISIGSSTIINLGEDFPPYEGIPYFGVETPNGNIKIITGSTHTKSHLECSSNTFYVLKYERSTLQLRHELEVKLNKIRRAHVEPHMVIDDISFNSNDTLNTLNIYAPTRIYPRTAIVRGDIGRPYNTLVSNIIGEGDITSIIEERIRNVNVGVEERITNNVEETTTGQDIDINNIPVDYNLIKPYHTRLTIDKKSIENENTNRYFGIELEIDSTRGPKNKMATQLNYLLNDCDYNKLVKFEKDGSLSDNGIEIIFQPMTMNFINSKREVINKALKHIDTHDYTSHDNGKCGLHIHVSRDAFEDDDLDKIMLIFENFKNELITFSRRKESQMTWTKFITDTVGWDKISYDYIKHNKDDCTGHHVVINNYNRNTVEFRLFRGTTNKITFYACIQLIDNLLSLVKERKDIINLTWDEIINYNPEYVELIEYNKKRRIYSTHKLAYEVDKQEVNERGCILVKPFQMSLEGDN